jgi:hypothetical protein
LKEQYAKYAFERAYVKNKEVCSSERENNYKQTKDKIKGHKPAEPKIAVNLLRKQLDNRISGGGNYFAKSSNSYTPSNPNTIIRNLGSSNAFLHIEDPTENRVTHAEISKSGRIIMDPSAA